LDGLQNQVLLFGAISVCCLCQNFFNFGIFRKLFPYNNSFPVILSSIVLKWPLANDLIASNHYSRNSKNIKYETNMFAGNTNIEVKANM